MIRSDDAASKTVLVTIAPRSDSAGARVILSTACASGPVVDDEFVVRAGDQVSCLIGPVQIVTIADAALQPTQDAA